MKESDYTQAGDVARLEAALTLLRSVTVEDGSLLWDIRRAALINAETLLNAKCQAIGELEEG